MSDLRVGQRVITMMQALGGVRARGPGGYAEYVVVHKSAIASIAGDVGPLAMASSGLASVTAFEGLRKMGGLKNRRITVTGAAGGIGSAAVAITEAAGAEGYRHWLASRASRIRSFIGSCYDVVRTRRCSRSAWIGDARWCSGHGGQQVVPVVPDGAPERRSVISSGSSRRKRCLLRCVSSA
jgi:hypothetical protein